jgi:hypothetical protein
MEDVIWIGTGAGVLLLLLCIGLIKWSVVLARPDEWLLRIRDGKLLDAGVGITVWRKPGDVVARFSSTLQRVKFTAEARSTDRLAVKLEGFVLWSVAPGGDNPLRAFSKLGIANLDQRPTGLRSDKHLLTGPQHKAFQALLAAELQQSASTLKLAELLSGPGRLLPAFTTRMSSIAERLGINMEQVEVVAAVPADATLLTDLSVEEEQRVRSEAAQVRLAASERSQREQLESKTRLADEEARARADRDAFVARAELAIEEERARLLEAQAQVWRRKAEGEREHRLAELETRRVIEAREAELLRAKALAKEETEALLQQARLARLRLEAEANADATRITTSAEANKPQEVRDHELARLVAEKTAAALASLPLKEARWISVGNETPAAGLQAMIAGVSELLHGQKRGEP